ncbi:MAG: alpha-hydroxy-acid oxidizing protein, partial [Floccifex sp.]
MNDLEVLEKSRSLVGSHCFSCPVCNGKACSNHIPGPGAKGSGQGAIRNYEAWQKYDLNMDTIVENKKVDTTFTVFNHTFQYPIFAGPVGAVNNHYGDSFNDVSYNEVLIRGCRQAGILGFTGDGINPDIMVNSCQIIKENHGMGIPTIKPWHKDVYFEKLQLALQSGAIAIAMDIDASGLPFLKNAYPPAGRKSVEELKEIIDATPVPFIVKGIMSVKGALKAKEAGASAIVVSNHGGRVLDGTPATADVLEDIVKAVNHSMSVFVDGGIRTGYDVFKALALGADGVLICRPFVNRIYGAKEEGIQIFVNRLGQELIDAMEMCGAK